MRKVYISKIKSQHFTVPVMGWVKCRECGGTGKGTGNTNCPVCNGDGQLWGQLPMIGPDGSHRILGGEQVYLDKTMHFENVRNSFRHGHLSEFVVFKDEPGMPDTPPEVIEALDKLVASPVHKEVFTEEGYEKSLNPEKYEERKRREALEAKLVNVEKDKAAAIKAAKAEAAKEKDSALKAMQAKLEKAEKELAKKG